MTPTHRLAAPLLALILLSGWTQAEPPGADTAGTRRGEPYTSARLDQATMEALLVRVMPLLRRGEIEEAERIVARRVAEQTRLHGASSMEVGDLLMAFGVTLFHTARDPETKRRAIAFLRRATEVYIARFGRDHREVGLAYSDIGNALLVLEPEDPPAEAEQAIEEAWRIRRVTLGARNVETASSLLGVARIKGLPSRTRGERSRIDASAALFRQAIGDFGTQVVIPSLHGAITGLFDLADMYMKNDLPREALAAAREGEATYRRHFRDNRRMCGIVAARSRLLTLALDTGGHERAARTLDRRSERLPCGRVPPLRVRTRSRP